jgi:predicted permease
MLGVPPLHGRTFAEGDDAPGAPATVVLSHDVWTSRFASDPEAVGRTVRMNGETATIVGVMPPGFRFPFNQDLWVTLRDDPTTLARRARGQQVYGYLRDGVSIEAASAETDAFAGRIAELYPETNRGIGARVVGFQEAMSPPQIVTMLTMMVAMVLGVLLVACANVTNVLMARAAARDREVAIRSAMGAERWQVIRQLLAEAVVLGILGGLVGIVVAFYGLRAFEVLIPEDGGAPYWIYFAVDAPALLVPFAVTHLAAIAAGTAPALRASGGGVSGILRDESRGSSSLRLGRFSQALVVGELAVSCGLMIAAGLLVRALVDLNSVELGMDPETVMTARLGLFDADYPDADARNRFYVGLLDEAAAAGGVRSVALASSLPATFAAEWDVAVEGVAYDAESDLPEARGSVVSHGFFETFGIRIAEGREFTRAESEWGAGDAPVAVVNRSLADRLLGGQALGRRIRLRGEEEWYQIVGVVEDVHTGVGEFGGEVELIGAVYVPLGTLDRIFGGLYSIFGVAGLFLAAVGLYGVIDFSVSARVREMGVRMALGAQRPDVVKVVVGRVIAQTALGVGLGLLLGAALSWPLASFIFGMRSFDLAVYAVVVGTLALTAAAAATAPVLRAIRVDPVVAMSAS